MATATATITLTQEADNVEELTPDSKVPAKVRAVIDSPGCPDCEPIESELATFQDACMFLIRMFAKWGDIPMTELEVEVITVNNGEKNA